MKEKPIIFSAPMILTILEGRKTMTRRAITVPWCKGMRSMPYEPYYVETDGRLLYMDECGEYHPMENKCPYGKPGTRLWVRETWTDLRGMGFGNDPVTDKPWNWTYKADIKPGSDSDRARIDYGVKWKPSIHMPKAAARIWLEVTNVRVERLQEITEEDAIAEGALSLCDPSVESIWGEGFAKACFRNLWDSLNAKRGFPFDASPWVWVIEFKMIKP